jgi:hypothetical protein
LYYKELVVRGVRVVCGSISLISVALKGEFQYSFIYGEMIVPNGTEICAGLAVLSPFVKRQG